MDYLGERMQGKRSGKLLQQQKHPVLMCMYMMIQILQIHFKALASLALSLSLRLWGSEHQWQGKKIHTFGISETTPRFLQLTRTTPSKGPGSVSVRFGFSALEPNHLYKTKTWVFLPLLFFQVHVCERKTHGLIIISFGPGLVSVWFGFFALKLKPNHLYQTKTEQKHGFFFFCYYYYYYSSFGCIFVKEKPMFQLLSIRIPLRIHFLVCLQISDTLTYTLLHMLWKQNPCFQYL